MTEKVISLNIKSGIQRDGTLFDSPSYVDGVWVRFQRGKPRKIGGYNGIFSNASDISRGMTMTSVGGINYVLSGYSAGLEQWQTNNVNGTGYGPVQYTLSNFTSSSLNLWQFDIAYSVSGGGQTLVAHPGQNLQAIDSTVNTPVLSGAFPGGALTKVGIFTDFGYTTNGSNVLTLSGTDINVGAGQLITGTYIPTGTTVSSVTNNIVNMSQNATGTTPTLTGVAITGTAGQFSCSATTLATGDAVGVTGTLTGTGSITNYINPSTYYIIATNGTTTFTLSSTLGGTAITTTAGTTAGLTFTHYTPVTFDNQIAVSGGCVIIHPYLFVYGNDGLIQNSSAGNFNNWVSADSNINNVSTGKIVKGLPVRGGTTSPSGLFWALDSLIRVSYTPNTVGSSTFYWRYDIISSQSSILSSSSVIEYDGLYYWAGVDRFLVYNGVVQEVPNTQNQNYFFDNLNYAQRQKVWVTKVPRWGEIWWFYPRGSSTECNDAVIYNVREQVWYDAGQAIGAQRSAGTFSEVFHFPIWGGNKPSGYEVVAVTIVTGGTNYAVNDVIALTGGTGTNALFTVTSVSGGVITGLTVVNGGIYQSILAGTLATKARSPSIGAGLTVTVTMTQSYILWQHETGTDQVYLTNVDAVQSYYETNNIGWVTGGPGAQDPMGTNRWIRVERVEPDFVQSGNMNLYVTGKGYADDVDVTTGPYTFSPTTLKIDMREQRREMRLRFESNTFGGNYQTGKILLSCDIGDERSTGNP
jgi:hypothetical protein